MLILFLFFFAVTFTTEPEYIRLLLTGSGIELSDKLDTLNVFIDLIVILLIKNCMGEKGVKIKAFSMNW